MAHNILTVVTLGKKSGIPADACENTFSFITAAATDAALATALDNIEAALENFYITNGTSGFSVQSQLSKSFSVTAGSSKMTHYDVTTHLAGTPHGSPIRAPHTFALTTVGANSGPDELAACLSFHSNYTTDVEFGVGTRPRARDRGRVYIGPLYKDAIQNDATTWEPFLYSVTATAIAEAATRLRADANTEWATWSRANAAMATVESGWVDNALDTQRRRGNKPTVRTTW